MEAAANELKRMTALLPSCRSRPVTRRVMYHSRPKCSMAFSAVLRRVLPLLGPTCQSSITKWLSTTTLLGAFTLLGQGLPGTTHEQSCEPLGSCHDSVSDGHANSRLDHFDRCCTDR